MPGSAETALQRQLRDGAPARATALEAFKLARRKFQAGERIDMNALAQQLGVSRVTLYRWVGTREQLLVEVLWSLTERTLAKNQGEAKGTGARWIANVMTQFITDVVDHAGMRRFLAEEGDFAMRLLTRRSSGFQPRLVNSIEVMLTEQVDAGTFNTAIPLDELAYILVRIVESYVHLDLITGETPDPRRAEVVLHGLLR
jgi:AcrR family transcriptional regulator